jgi:polyferredoxin
MSLYVFAKVASFNAIIRPAKNKLLSVSFILWSIFMFRPFCRFFCPLGAIYSFFNKSAIFGIKVDSTKCTHCNACVNFCKMDTLEINDRECIRCGECKSQCHFNAIK